MKKLFIAALTAAAAVLLSGCTSGSKYVIEGSGDQLVDVYTVGGVKVREQVRAAEATQGLQGGIYIVNGKKVAVK